MEWVSLKVEDGVCLMTMNHPEQNRLSGPFAKEVREAMAVAANDSAVKSVVMASAIEKFFCNGLDLDWMMKQEASVLEAFLINTSRLLKDTALFPKPLIGAISGHTFGLGAIWSSGYDFRIMREDRGWVCFPEMDINIPFLPGMIAICEHGLGTTAFREMAWSAKRYTGPEAVKAGYAREVAAKEQVLPRCMELAKFMAAKAQPAFSLTKQRWAARVARTIDELDPDAIRAMPAPGK